MSKVKRYETESDMVIYEDKEGDFVLYKDYEQLQKANQELLEALEQILGWRELRDDNGFPVERIEGLARQAISGDLFALGQQLRQQGGAK